MIEEKYGSKFKSTEEIFSQIRRGDRIFVSTACAEPQYTVNALMEYVETHPKAFAETEVMHIWTLGVAPYADEKYTYNFRHNSFFVSDNTRDSVNRGVADYTPIFLSQIPRLINTGRIPIDTAIIQTSLPDKNGFVSMGISVDICRAAVDMARLVIAQVNSFMPRVHGDTFINMDEIDFCVRCDEPLLQFAPSVPDEVAMSIAKNVSRIVLDGDTIQIGYGSTPNAILAHLADKNDLGIHSELLTDSMVYLIKKGVVTNKRKNVNRGKTISSFCMGSTETYQFLDDNPTIEFRSIDYTNDPRVICQIENMTAINAALQVDLTGQATAESIGKMFYSGIGGSADFMRGTVWAPGGKTILVLQSTARGGEVSRIVPLLDSGAGVTLNRGDIHYIVTEYGVAYIHGKNIRERAMSLIAIAHPQFRPYLIEEAKRLNLIYQDQAFIPGEKGEYPAYLETVRTTKTGLVIKLRPVKLDDEPLIKDLFYSMSDKSLERRFMSVRYDVLHPVRQTFVVIDYTKEIVILATVEVNGKEIAVGMGQAIKDPSSQMAEVAFAVRDSYHNQGIGTELLSYLVLWAKKEGLLGFTADVLLENKPMLHVFEKMGFDLRKKAEGGVYELWMKFK